MIRQTNRTGDSPIEWRMIRAIEHRLAGRDATLSTQRTAHTPWGSFRYDLFVETPTRRIVVECDGRDYHDPVRDAWRDAITLGHNVADEVWRLPGTTITHGDWGCAYLLMKDLREIFASEDVYVRKLAGAAYVAVEEGDACHTADAGFVFTYANGRAYKITRRSAHEIVPGSDRRWVRMWRYASDHVEPLDALRDVAVGGATASYEPRELLARDGHDLYASAALDRLFPHEDDE